MGCSISSTITNKLFTDLFQCVVRDTGLLVDNFQKGFQVRPLGFKVLENSAKTEYTCWVYKYLW